MQLIRQLRQSQGWSQRDLGRRVGCTGAHISDLENGKTGPSRALLQRLAHTLNVPVAELLADSLAATPDTGQRR